MKFKSYLTILLVLILGFSACENVDDGIIVIPERDRAEQQIIDNDSLLGYFDTHYFNSEEISMIADPSVYDLVITELGEGETVPAGHTLLSASNLLETHNTVFEETDYTFYILRIKQGGGSVMPSFADNIQINYAGNTMDGEVFDSSVNPVVFDLTGLIPGWSRVIPQFNTAEGFVINSDGTVSYTNFGMGAMFLPSGLGYWSGSAPGIPVYSNLIFRFDVYDSSEIDHDGDNVPSFLEDINGDSDLNNDDSDENGLPDYLDNDDDGDLIVTRLEDLEPDMDLETDSDGDGITTNDIGDDDPTNDDTDGDGTPNYLDTDDDCSRLDDDNEDGIPDCDN